VTTAVHKQGTFVVSIDLELAWGGCDIPLSRESAQGLGKERQIVAALLRLLHEYGVSATWAVVGHLFEEQPCAHDHGRAHPEFPRPVYANEPRDWFFQHPPHGQTDPLWSAPDVIEMVRRASPAQEFGTHTYAHLILDETRINPAAVAIDLAIAKSRHHAAGLPFEVMVFPRNHVGCLETVAASGIKTYRGPGANPPVNGPLRAIRRVSNLMRYLAARTPPVFTPRIDEWGMVDVPGSMLLLGRDGIRSHIRPLNLRRMASKGLRRAVREQAVFHLWFHASNLAHDTDVQLQTLREILQEAADLRDRGLLRIMPMGDVARETRNGGGSEVERARDAAVQLHHEQAGKFADWYQSMADADANAFVYGRVEMNAVLEPLLRSLPRGSRVLDVGCGTGEQVRWIRSMGLEVVGVEPAPGMRAAARELNPDIEIVDGTADALPFADGTFDLVISLEVLRYLAPEDRQSAYREMLRVLRPGGRLACSLVNRYAFDGFYLFHHAKRIAARAGLAPEPAHCEFTTPSLTARELTTAGAAHVDIHGRMFAPLRIAYKLHKGLGRLAARVVRPAEAWLAGRRWHVATAGHLIAVAARDTRPAAR
jgi:SAM-dependent methyltransferase